MQESNNRKSNLSTIILTALITSFCMYMMPRLGDFMVPEERTIIDIGKVGDTLLFATVPGKERTKIVREKSSFTLNGKSLTADKMVKLANNSLLKEQQLSDSVNLLKKIAEVYKANYEANADSVYIYRNIANIIKEKYGIDYSVKTKGSKYIFTNRNSGKIDSSLVLYELYGNRLRLIDGYWQVISEREYKREQRRK